MAGQGAVKTLILVVAEAPHGYRAEVRNRTGTRVALAEPPAPRPSSARWQPTVAVLSQRPEAVERVGRLELFGPEAGAVTALGSPQDLPDSALLLSGLHALVIDRIDASSLSPAQRRALLGFVAFGGGVVVVGGPTGARTASALPEELVPLAPSATAAAPVAPLADLLDRPVPGETAVVVGELRRGRPVLAGPGGPPLVVQAEYGAGRVVQLAFDPLAEPMASDSALADLAWQQGLRRVLDEPGIVPAGTAPPDQIWSSVVQPSPWPGWPGRSLWLLAAYSLLAVPAAFLLLSWRRRATSLWLAAPLAAVALSASVLVFGAGREGATRSAVEVSTTGPGGETLVNTYAGIQSAGKGVRRIGLGREAAGTSALVPTRTTMDPRIPQPAQAGAGRATVTYSDSGGAVALEAQPGQVRPFQSASVTEAAALDIRLRLVGNTAPDRGGLRVTGTVANRSDRHLLGPRAQLPEGAQARLGRWIEPGQTVTVDAPFVWPRTMEAGDGIRAGAGDLAMFAAADHALARGGRVAIVGLRPAHDGVLAVAAQVAPLERSENVVAGTGRVQMVASGTARPGEIVHVYDLVALPGAERIGLRYTIHSPAPEVYDWQSGTWRTAPRADLSEFDGPALLRDTEIDQGLVRVRTKGRRDRSDYTLVLTGRTPS